MKFVFLILAALNLILGLIATIQDSDGLFLFLGIVFACFWGFLAWLWRKKSPIKRAGEQIENAVSQAKGKHEAYKELSPALKKRTWKLRIIGTLIFAVGIVILANGYGSAVTVIIATFFWIGGGACFLSANPGEYNESVDMTTMVGFNTPTTIDKVYEDFKNINTPLGSCYLGRFATMKQKAMIFGPDSRGTYVYFWLTRSGDVGYIGHSFLEGFIKERYTQPIYPATELVSDNLSQNICYSADIIRFKDDFKTIMTEYAKTGKTEGFKPVEKSEVYMFTEDFKLTGQHFDLTDVDGNLIYEVEGTIPLINIRIFDAAHNEVFKMTKEIGHALATYNFFKEGQPYGTLEEQFAIVRDRFTMQIDDGKLELVQYTASVGNNYKVTLDGRVIGYIMDDLTLNAANLIFDNAVIIVYDEKYRALITAMAVMAARELVRDERGGISNRNLSELG